MSLCDGMYFYTGRFMNIHTKTIHTFKHMCELTILHLIYILFTCAWGLFPMYIDEYTRTDIYVGIYMYT